MMPKCLGDDLNPRTRRLLRVGLRQIVTVGDDD